MIRFVTVVIATSAVMSGVLHLSLLGQATATSDCFPQTFQAAVIRLHSNSSEGSRMEFTTAGRLTVQNWTLLRLVSTAYDMPSNRVFSSLPWVKNVGFDLEANVPDAEAACLSASSSQQIHAAQSTLLKDLLKKRFRADIRYGDRNLPAYTIRTTRKGVQMSTFAHTGTSIDSGPGHITIKSHDVVSALSTELSRLFGTPVINASNVHASGGLKVTWDRGACEDDGGDKKLCELSLVAEALPGQTGLTLQRKHADLATIEIVAAETPEVD